MGEGVGGSKMEVWGYTQIIYVLNRKLTEMNPRDFCYWLQGYFEVGKSSDLSKEQVEVIRKHLRLVFDNVIEYDKHSTVSINYDTELELLNAELKNNSPLIHWVNNITC